MAGTYRTQRTSSAGAPLIITAATDPPRAPHCRLAALQTQGRATVEVSCVWLCCFADNVNFRGRRIAATRRRNSRRFTPRPHAHSDRARLDATQEGRRVAVEPGGGTLIHRGLRSATPAAARGIGGCPAWSSMACNRSERHKHQGARTKVTRATVSSLWAPLHHLAPPTLLSSLVGAAAAVRPRSTCVPALRRSSPTSGGTVGRPWRDRGPWTSPPPYVGALVPQIFR